MDAKLILQNRFLFQEVRWALAAVGSRAFPNGSQLMMCPLLDLLNHPTSQVGGPLPAYRNRDWHHQADIQFFHFVQHFDLGK